MMSLSNEKQADIIDAFNTIVRIMFTVVALGPVTC